MDFSGDDRALRLVTTQIDVEGLVMSTRLIWVAFFLFAIGHPHTAQGEDPQPHSRAVTVAGTDTRYQPVSSTAPTGNAGLFVGINAFSDDFGLRSLDFAVNDAVAQAHLFVIELKLIPANNTFLCLAGQPTTDPLHQQLAALEKAGVQRVDPRKTAILRALLTVEKIPQDAKDLLVVAISSHGFEDRGTPYAMPTDGLRGLLADTAINLQTVQHRLSKSKAGKRLLILDACRERPSADAKGGDQPMKAAFRQALAQAAGQAVLLSCDASQVSFENPDLGHGVFTHFLLQAMRGHAAADDRGFITLGSVCDYVAQGVHHWAQRHKPELPAQALQRPSFIGPNDARQIPLAIDPGMRERQAKFKNNIQALIQQLKLKTNRKGKFNFDHFTRLADALEAIDPNDPSDRELLEAAKAFARGDIPDLVFIPYLDQALTPSLHPQGVPPTPRQKPNDPATDAVTPPGLLVTGDGNSGHDVAKQVEAYRRAAERGDVSAMIALGNIYHNGDGVNQDRPEAVKWFRQAAEMGKTDAMVHLGSAYEFGYGVTENRSVAADWFRRAADLGNVDAMIILGSKYQYGNGVPQDHHQTVMWWRRAAKAGNPGAMTVLGSCYRDGRGVAQDYRKALSWYRKAAALGHSSAMNCIASAYTQGQGVDPNPREAARYFHKAAELGHATAMSNLGGMYAQGRGVARDLHEAVKWYRKAADLGHPKAMNNLATSYLLGLGVAQDRSEAVRWYRKAAAAGYEKAKKRLRDLGE